MISSAIVAQSIDLVQLFSSVDKVRTPLALAALAFIVLFLLYRQVLRRAAALSKSGTESLVKYLFVLALCALVLGFGGYVLTQLIGNTARVKISGRVYDAADPITPVSDAIVHIRTDVVRDVSVDQQGDFAITLSRPNGDQNAETWAEAPLYKPSSMQDVALSSDGVRQDFGLTHIAGEGAFASARCLLGKWLEKPNGAYVWAITRQGSQVRVHRIDGWADGLFRFAGSAWIGDLRWGNGADWTGVELSPSKACNSISTNKDWWYERLP
jgi:hypothetical protein